MSIDHFSVHPFFVLLIFCHFDLGSMEHIFANIDFDPIEFNVKNPEDPIRILSITKSSKLNCNAHDLVHCTGLEL